MESENVVLDIWQTFDGYKTIFHAAFGSNPTISGGYHSILDRSKLMCVGITHIRRSGNIVPWSQRFIV